MLFREPDPHRTDRCAEPRGSRSEQADIAAIERVRSGDEGAFEELVRRNYDRVWRVTWRIVRHDQHAEDLVQEVFGTALATLPGFRGEPPFKTWLFQITVAQAMTFVNSRRDCRERDRLEPEPSSPPLEHGRDPLPACFETLDCSLRAPISLKLEGLGYGEIAQALGLQVGTVRTRLSLARSALSQCVRRKRAAHDA